MASRADLALEIDGAITEGRACLLRRGHESGGQDARLLDPPHPPAAASCGRLDQQREADPLGGCDDAIDGIRAVERRRIECSRHDGDARVGRGPARGQLVAESLDSRRRWTDEDETGVDDGPGERRPLRQEPVSRMDRLGAGWPGPHR